MDWTCAGLIALLGLGSLWLVASIASDRNREQRRRTVAHEAIAGLVSAIGEVEPTTPDANDPMRSRFMVCGRWPESGHTKDCAWRRVVALTYRYEEAP